MLLNYSNHSVLDEGSFKEKTTNLPKNKLNNSFAVIPLIKGGMRIWILTSAVSGFFGWEVVVRVGLEARALTPPVDAVLVRGLPSGGGSPSAYRGSPLEYPELTSSLDRIWLLQIRNLQKVFMNLD